MIHSKMKKLLLFPLLALLFIACAKEEDPYLIGKNRIGLLTPEVQVNQLDSIYANDSISREVNQNRFYGSSNEIRIFDEAGKQLLLLEPVQAFDSTSTIGYIQVLDPRFKTAKGLNIKSTFQEIVENYSISRIENTLSAVVIFIDDLNAYITIDKKELPAELRYDTESIIQSSQIPDDARFKYFMIGWD